MPMFISKFPFIEMLIIRKCNGRSLNLNWQEWSLKTFHSDIFIVFVFISVNVFVFVKLDFEEARIGMTTGVKVASYRVATEKWPRISLRRKIVVNSLNYHPFYTLTVAEMYSLNILYSYTIHIYLCS